MLLGLRRFSVLIGVLAAVVAVAALPSAAARAYGIRVSVTTMPATRPLPADFLGLALEYNTIPRWVGNGSEPVDPVLVQLIRNLAPTGRPSIRIGGQSTERTWWPVPGVARPLGVTYNLTPSWAGSAQALAKMIDAQLLLGINLEADRTRISQAEADQLQAVGSNYIGALVIGNEPDLYPTMPWYKLINGKPAPWYDQAGTPVFSRGPGYGVTRFVNEFLRTLRVMPQLPIAGPDASTGWLDTFSHFLSPGSRVRMLTSHAYGLNQCVPDPTSPLYPSVPNLLRLSASRNLLLGTSPAVARAHRSGATFRIDEMGSITCNGRQGVSDTMASALWLLDALFAVARQGVDGVNLHTYPNSANGLFDLQRTNGAWNASVHPLYYGALMFAQAAPAGSRMVRVAAPTQNGLRAWATLGPDQRVRVVVINAGLNGGIRAQVRAPALYRSNPGGLERLQASSAYASHGVTLGGQQFGTTTTGALPPPVPQIVKPHRGIYAVTLPPGSAALLTLTRP
ncbi:MAG: glycosyl hydrolase family 79 C-terminal domain-containing protein [Solirubrobacteraceae bacterium]